MDTLEGYSSDESESDHDHDQFADPITSLTPYLQNYSDNQGMGGLYAYLPWSPSPPVMTQLRVISRKAIRHLQEQHPDFHLQYRWHPTSAPAREVEGKYLLTNTQAFREHHITLTPNMIAPTHVIDQVVDNLRFFVGDLKMPRLLVSVDHQDLERKARLRLVLFKDLKPTSSRQPTKKYLSFPVEPAIKVFRSPMTQNVFLLITLEHLTGGQVLDALKEAFMHHVEAYDIKVSRGAKFSKEETLEVFRKSTFHYHVTVMTGEAKRVHQTKDVLAKGDLALINESFRDIRIPELTALQVKIDRLAMVKMAGAGRKSTEEIPFNFD